MFRFFTFLLITVGLLLITSGFSSDDVDNYIPANTFLTEQTRSILNAIKLAEDNEDWETYQNLRSEFISEIKQSNPDLAKSYRTIPSDNIDFDNVDGDMNGTIPSNFPVVQDEEFPTRTIPEKWENDVPFRSGQTLRDFSMDVSADGHIYVSVATSNGAPDDSLIIYRSLDGGITWEEWTRRVGGTAYYIKTEILCFDHPLGDKYVLLFYTYSTSSVNQVFRVAQYNQSDASTPGSVTLVDSLVLDFAVDRNFPMSNYRAIAFYDSSNRMYSIRSEPSSYGTTWQDKHAIGHVGRDVDLCYGLNGSVYATYNGFGTGNLYVRENLSYADPASWSSATILETGSTDTTMHAEVIATRESQSNIKVQVVYTQDENNNLNLKRAEKDDGGSWTSSINFVLNSNFDFYYPCLDIDHFNATTEVHNVYRNSAAGNAISYKYDSGSGWTSTVHVSDFLPTGTQKPYVAEVNGEPVVVYAGWGPNTLYCDNNGWVSSVTGNEPGIAKEFELSQNFPNPFNPSTTIKYQIANLKPQNTTLQIYNSLGQLVRTLVNTEQSQGDYSVVWNGLDNSGNTVSSGVYFYKLTYGDFVKSRKLLKLK